MAYDKNGNYVADMSEEERRWNPQDHMGFSFNDYNEVTAQNNKQQGPGLELQRLQNLQLQMQIERQRANELQAQGLNPDGSPKRPEWETLLDSDGKLKNQYQLSVDKLDPSQMQGYQKYKTEAMRAGPSAWAGIQNQQQDQQAAAQKAQAAVQAMTGSNQAMSQLAMRGGLGSGARTSLAKQSARDLMAARQGVSRQQGINKLGIASTDEQNRIGQLGNLASSETDIGKYNTTLGAQQNEKNLTNLLKEVEAKRMNTANTYNEQMRSWAANRQADATANSGGGGK